MSFINYSYIFYKRAWLNFKKEHGLKIFIYSPPPRHFPSLGHAVGVFLYMIEKCISIYDRSTT